MPYNTKKLLTLVQTVRDKLVSINFSGIKIQWRATKLYLRKWTTGIVDHNQWAEKLRSFGFERIPDRVAGIRTVAIFETLVFLTLITLCSHLFGAGDRYLSITPHPFWAVVLLITVRYGTYEGVVSAGLSALFLLIGNLPTQLFGQSLYDYYYLLFKDPLLWLVSAVALGRVRDGITAGQQSIVERCHTLEQQLKDISQAYLQMQQANQAFKIQLESQPNTQLTLLKTLTNTQTLPAEKMLLQTTAILNTLLKAEQCSIFLNKKQELNMIDALNWQAGKRSYKTLFSPKNKLYKAVIEEQRTLCVAHQNDAVILGKQGLLAAPLICKRTKTVLGMIKIEQLDFMALNDNTIHLFTFLGEWFGTTYQQALNTKTSKVKTRVGAP